METRLFQCDNQIMKAADRKAVARILRQGGLVAFPTETVYGLGGNGLDETAAGKIYEAKGRPSDNPLILHIAEFDELVTLVSNVTEEARILAEQFWPGPLTMILPKSNLVPYSVTGGLDTVAIRMPSHPIAKQLIQETGLPIAAPSANTSGRPSPTLCKHVVQDLWGKIDAIVDGGQVGIGLESTIIDLTSEKPTILRPGYITTSMLNRVLTEGVEMDRGFTKQGSMEGIHPKAPGMKYKHYAPKGDLTIFEGQKERVVQEINRLAASQEEDTIGIIATDETVACYPRGLVLSVGNRQQEETIARELYAVLREFDDRNIATIYAESFASDELGQAIMNRLLKAANHQVIKVS